jgi:hypothetical protein
MNADKGDDNFESNNSENKNKNGNEGKKMIHSKKTKIGN